jgi:hypothetical protein
MSFYFPYIASKTYNFSYQSINQFGESIGLFRNSITFDAPSLISNLSLSFNDLKRNITIQASERFSQQFSLDDF